MVAPARPHAALIGILLASIALVGITPGTSAVEDDGDEVRGYYLGGGSFFGGVARSCTADDLPGATPGELQVDIGAACDLRCPGGTCDIEVWDDHYGNNVLFRVCFDDEEFCRPGLYWGSTSIPGHRVTVAPHLETSTHGVVIVR